MHQSTKIETLSLAALGLSFALIVGCTGEDPSSSVTLNDDNPFIVHTDTVVGPDGESIIRTDTIHKQIDTVMRITETGETTFVAETLYVGTDTTLHWTGNSALVITEILPINLDFTDEDGDDGAWVEIYNAGSQDANLKGYSLAESREDARKWIFGSEIIRAKSFRIVFCDNKNRTAAIVGTDGARKRSDGSEYNAHFRTHTNWKIEKKGGTIYLIDQFYAIRDSVDFPELGSGISWGIMNGGVWKYFDKPTPEARNTESTAYDDLVPSVDLSKLKSGFYKEPITLNPPSLEEGVKLRCTQDGSEPKSSSQEFNSQITISSNTTFRCAAFKEGALGREVVTKTFFIGETVEMPVVAISVDPSFFDKAYIETHADKPEDAPSGLYADQEFPVHVQYFAKGSSSSDVAWEIDAGISLMGGYSRLNDKKSVAIEMHEEYQNGRLKYPLFDTRKSDSVFKAFNLRNNGNRYVSDYIADAMAGAILEGSGVDYQRSRQVVVFYNGKYYGIHDMRERFNRAYVETNYGINSNSVEMIKQLGGLSKITASGDGSIDNYVNMLKTIGGGDMTVAENYEAAKKLIDVGNLADYMAAQIYYHNGDWPNNNVRAWRSPDHPWKFMVYDVDHGFDWMWGVNGGEFSQGNNMFAWIKKGGGNHPCNGDTCFASLYLSLIKNETFKHVFLNHSAMMLDKYLNGEKVAQVIDAMVGKIPTTEMDRDLNHFKQNEKYYQNSCGDGFSRTGSCLKQWASERDTKVLNEYKGEFDVGDMVTVTISVEGNGTVVMDEIKMSGTKYTGKFFNGVKMDLTATPTNGGVFEAWSDGETSPTRTVTISEGLTLSAKFK